MEAVLIKLKELECSIKMTVPRVVQADVVIFGSYDPVVRVLLAGSQRCRL